MARVVAQARRNSETREWCLVFDAGWQRQLRIGGYFAGFKDKEQLKNDLLAKQLAKMNAMDPWGGPEDTGSSGSSASRYVQRTTSAHTDVLTYLGCISSEISACKTPRRPSSTDHPAKRRKEEERRHAIVALVGKDFSGTRPEPHDEVMEQYWRGKDEVSPYTPANGVVKNRSRDVVLSKDLEVDLRGSSSPDSPSTISPTSEKRRNWSSSTFLPSTEVRNDSVLARASPSALGLPLSPSVKDGAGPSRDKPLIVGDVDDFVLLCNGRQTPVTNLPNWIGGFGSGGSSSSQQVCLMGLTGDGQEPVEEIIEMWRLIIRRSSKPQFLVKTATGNWLRLLQPRDSYVCVMSGAYALAYFLHFVKKHPSASENSVEKYLVKKCSIYGEKPSLDKLSPYLKVIKSYAEEDPEMETASVLIKIFPNLLAKDHTIPKQVGNCDDGSNQLSKVITSSNGRTPHRKHASVKPRVPTSDDEENYALVGVETGKHGSSNLHLKSDHSDQKGRRLKFVLKKDVHNHTWSTQKLDCHSEDDTDREVKKSGKHAAKPKFGHFRDEDNLAIMPVDFDIDHLSKDVPTRRRKDEPQIPRPDDSEMEDPPICVICDDGGELIYCEGPCQRHFHATERAGADCFCPSLGLTTAEVEGMGKFYCDNCLYKQHQCFVCGELGSSARTSDGWQEIQCCDVPSCKRFYHVECAAELLMPRSNWQALADEIHKGREKLYCPRHCCEVCGKAELREPGVLVQCRRCPRGWHRECLTKYYRSQEVKTTPIWRHLKRQYFYCRYHDILPDLQTPKRDHVKFPVSYGKKKLKIKSLNVTI